MIFDTWGGVLTGRDYREFSLNYMHKIVDGLIRENDGRRVPDGAEKASAHASRTLKAVYEAIGFVAKP